jgi:hypothetical protein
MYPPSSDSRNDSWNSGTDGARFLANTLLYAANHFPTANAGGDQAIEVTSPAGASFTLNATGSDLDGDPLTYTWSGAASATGSTVIVDVLPPLAPNKTETRTLTVTVIDGKGGETTDSVTLTVSDVTGPVLHGVPSSIVTAEATGSAGAAVTFGPVTATDAVDGNSLVACSHLSGSVFPVGDTTVTCTSSDSRENATSASFIVRVTESAATTPGKAFGHGFIRENDSRYEFTFAAIERPSGREDGRLLFTAKSEHRGRRRSDHFLAKTVDSVTFTEDATVLFTGVGRWNGAAGYRYEVSAINKGKSNRRHRDIVRVTITAPGGAVVAHVDGALSGGDVLVWTR